MDKRWYLAAMSAAFVACNASYNVDYGVCNCGAGGATTGGESSVPDASLDASDTSTGGGGNVDAGTPSGGAGGYTMAAYGPTPVYGPMPAVGAGGTTTVARISFGGSATSGGNNSIDGGYPP